MERGKDTLPQYGEGGRRMKERGRGGKKMRRMKQWQWHVQFEEGASSSTTTGSAFLFRYLTRYKRKASTTHYDSVKPSSSSTRCPNFVTVQASVAKQNEHLP
jgi:hypothetical protein